MDKLVKAIQSNIKLKYKFYTIDNLIFRMHYRYTTMLLFTITLLITSQELIGEHIKCMVTDNKVVSEAIMNRYCFFTTTFTVVKYLNATMVDRGDIPHPGVGASGLASNDEVKHHAYYQWVPFVLFGQAILFYMPHLIWKREEGERMKKLVSGLENAAFAAHDEKQLTVGKMTVPSRKQVNKEFEKINKYFKDSLVVNRFWTLVLISCELLNLANIILNIYITDAFLGGQFIQLGTRLISEGFESTVDPLDVVFPKMTKCTFYKYGASGTLQPIDALCVMALNIINEKAYTVLWFWFVFLLAVTVLGVLWRMITFCLYSRSKRFNQMVFSIATSGRIKIWRLMTVIQNCKYMDWMFLVYLSKNMDGLVFQKFLDGLADDFEPTLIQYDEENDSYGEDVKLKNERLYMESIL